MTHTTRVLEPDTVAFTSEEWQWISHALEAAAEDVDDHVEVREKVKALIVPVPKARNRPAQRTRRRR
jgi:hypothetical protein